MLLQRSPSAEVFTKFAFTESRVNFSVANLMHQLFGFTAAAFRQQMVLVHAGPSYHGSGAQGAVGQGERLDIAQRLSAAKVAL